MSIIREKVYRQRYRVADSSLARYELYVGEDQMPDFDGSGQPVATSQTLPFTWSPTPPPSGTKVLYCVVRERNQYDLLSFNQEPTLLEIDAAGDEQLGPLSDPEILSVIDGENGQIIVTARYPRDVDQNEADVWEVYAEIGVDPDPDLDTPLAIKAFGKPGVEYNLTQAISGLTPGSTYHVIVVVRRSEESGSGEYGESTVTQHTLAVTYNVDAEKTSMFGGSEYHIGT